MQSTTSYSFSFSKRFQEMNIDTSPRYTPDDMGNGLLFADFFRDIIRWVPARKSWFVFAGRVWEEDVGMVRLNRYLKSLVVALEKRAQGIYDENLREAHLKRVSRMRIYHTRQVMITDAQPELSCRMADFDNDPWLFNCQNGTLDLRTRELKPFDPADMLTNMSNAVYDPDVISQRWQGFINDVCCRPADGAEDFAIKLQEWCDKAMFLQKALGYALTGDTSRECMFMLYGPTTRNGKGTCMETIQYMMGSYGATAKPESLCGGVNASGPSEDIARLCGKRFVNMSEPDRNLRLNASVVKTLTGNDTVTARFLYGASFEFKPCFKLFVNTNYRPRIDDITLFSSGRMRVIPFDRHFEESERDPELKARFREEKELSGILNWCLDGLHVLISEGLNPGAAIVRATNEYAGECDSLGQFMEQCMEKDPTAYTLTRVCREEYNKWCIENGYETESAVGFAQLMRQHATIGKKRTKETGSTTSVIFGWRFKNQQLSI